MKSHLCLVSFLCVCAVAGCGDDGSSVKECPNGQRYNSASDACEPLPEPDIPCNGDDECPTGQVCRLGKCQASSPAGECQTSDDCTDGKVCVEHKCMTVSECREDKDCGKDKVCNKGKCEDETKPECTEDAECGDGKVCQGGSCVEDSDPECTEDGDCGDGKVCREGRCEENPVTPCTDDVDCAEGLVCSEGRCEEPPTSCTVHGDCKDGLLCIELVCAVPPACQTADDCPEKALCSESLCMADPNACDTYLDCPENMKCRKGHCVDQDYQCDNEADCTDGRICRDNKCVFECKGNDECNDGYLCRKNRCVPECIGNDDCTAPAYCKGTKCTTECDADAVCPDRYLCKEGQCGYECRKDGDCSDGLKCDGVRCVACLVDADCSGDEVCDQNACVASSVIRYPCAVNGDGFKVFKTAAEYQNPVNPDGSINLCRLGYHPSNSEIAGGAQDTCVPLYKARSWDFYGDGIDSNCDGYDYNLSTAVFVGNIFQGSLSGNDSNSGKYDKAKNAIYPKRTIAGAFELHEDSYKGDDGKNYGVYPDILVDKKIDVALTSPLTVPTTDSDNLTALTALTTLSGYVDVFSYHYAIVRRAAEDEGSVSRIAFVNEGSFPKAYYRIHGGLTVNPGDFLEWKHTAETDRTTQEWTPVSTDAPYDVMIRPKDTAKPLSLAMNRFNLKMSASQPLTRLDGSMTLIGLSCGKGGCSHLDLRNVTLNVIAPDGMTPTASATAGTAGKAGINASYKVDISSGYSVNVCPAAQSCGGVSGGAGGCAGYASSNTRGLGGTDYNGEPAGKNGAAGGSSQDGTAGGAGGAGLTGAGYSHDTCSSDSVDESKGTGKTGSAGTHGANGRQTALQLAASNPGDGIGYVFRSNYDTATGIHGKAGAQGGGGGGGAVYNIYSFSGSDDSWINAGSGGNGGCGGGAGKAGGTGGSAIGLFLTSPVANKANVVLDNAQILVTAGSGAPGTDGADGGAGGIAGTNTGYYKSTLGKKTQCLKATAGGNGGAGGGGGAGAGGIAGKAVAFLVACTRNVSDFSADDRSTFANCGYEFPPHFLFKSNDGLFGAVTPGNNRADATELNASSGTKARTDFDGHGPAAFVDAIMTP